MSSVVVDARRAVQFGLVDPHVGGQVLVVVLDALVHDGDDHVGIARRELPGGVHVGVGAQSARLCEDVARIVVVPLHLLRTFALVEGEGDVAHLVFDGAGDALRPGGGGCRAAVVRSFSEYSMISMSLHEESRLAISLVGTDGSYLA